MGIHFEKGCEAVRCAFFSLIAQLFYINASMAVRQIVSFDEALAPGRKEVVEDSGQNIATCVTLSPGFRPQ